jgi:hypothetical protein
VTSHPNATSVINMTLKFPSYNLTEEDRLTHAKWLRAMAAFYGSMALLVLGLIVLTQASSLPPDEASEPPGLAQRLAG